MQALVLIEELGSIRAAAQVMNGAIKRGGEPAYKAARKDPIEALRTY